MTTTQKNITLIGAGAIGSHLALLGRNWALSAPVSLTIVDFDRVDKRNTEAQFHSRMGLGKNKAQALAQAMQGLFGVKAKAVPHKLTADNVETVLAGADLVLDCVDNAPTRQLIQAWASRHEVACLHGAIAADGSYARLMWDETFVADAGGEGQATCETGEHLPFIGIVAARMALLVKAHLETGERNGLHVHPGGVVLV